MEFIHRTRPPFRLITAQIETFAAGVAIGIEIIKPLNLIRTLQLRHLPQAATCLSTKCDVDEALQSADLGRLRLLRILLGLQTGFAFCVVLGP